MILKSGKAKNMERTHLNKDKFINVCRSCLGVFLYRLDTRTAPRYIKKIFGPIDA